MSGYVIQCQELTKHYGAVKSVDNLNLSVKEGEIFGLLGPNGAGKTTTILMLMGMIEPTSGSADVCGYNPAREPIRVKEHVGYLQDNMGFYEDMTAYENLKLIAELNDVDADENNINRVLKRVGLLESRDRKTGEYSRGMKQRLGIGDLLIKNADVMILDEPTLGLDPQGIESMLELIRDIAEKEGKTVLISSHLLNQVQKICTRIGIFYEGNLVKEGTIEDLAEAVEGDKGDSLDLEKIYKQYFEDKGVKEND